MRNSTVQTIGADELKMNDDAPTLVAMVYQSNFATVSDGLKNNGSATEGGGVSGIALVLVLSFIAVVTISRRPQQD